MTLRITTCLGENTFVLMRQLAEYLETQLAAPVTCVEDVSWVERHQQIDAGEVSVGWMCGLPYVTRAAQPAANIKLLAAPVMAGKRYGAQPCYFSDMVVHQDSPFQQFADLRGATWAYNDPGSHSGYNIIRTTLASMGANGRFLGQAFCSGGHMKSLAMILQRKVDMAALDSTVLDWAWQTQPDIRRHLRIIASLGPSPIPPLVIHKSVPSVLAERIHHLLLTMQETAVGRVVLASGGLLRFTAVTDADYDPIRDMVTRAQEVTF